MRGRSRFFLEGGTYTRAGGSSHGQVDLSGGQSNGAPAAARAPCPGSRAALGEAERPEDGRAPLGRTQDGAWRAARRAEEGPAPASGSETTRDLRLAMAQGRPHRARVARAGANRVDRRGGHPERAHRAVRDATGG